MLKIRLARFGKNKEPRYRIVVMDSRNKREGRVIDIIGHYDPKRDSDFKIDLQKIEEWTSKGAKMTERVISLVKRAKRESPASSN
ncbi:MAG: 30S ribosomal protein S16 [candidate division WOR-3 bacterium]